MLRCLARKQFVDRIWEPDDFDRVAAFWLRVYDEAEHPPSAAWKSQQSLELRFRGFPRSSGQTVANELVRRLASADTPVEVALTDPDTLSAKCEPKDGDRPPTRGLGIPKLNGSPFDGLVLEVRFTVADRGADNPSPTLVGATLVLVGELRDGAVVVKSVWSDRAFESNASAWDAAGPLEEHVLPAFDRYQREGKISRRLAVDLFNPLPPQPEPTFTRLKRKLVDVPFGRPRLVGLCWRLALFAGVPAGMLLYFLFDPVGGAILLCPGLVFGPLSFWVGGKFFRLEYERLYTNYTQFRAWYDWRFQVTERYSALPPNEQRAWFGNPAVRKLTAEVVEAGFVHSGDIISSSEAGGSVHRVFCAPDGRTYLVLFFVFETEPGPEQRNLWPASVSALCRTFRAPDGRCDTINFEGVFHRWGRKEPGVKLTIRPPATHPLDLYKLHVEVLERWSNETGLTYLSHESFDRFLTRHEQVAKDRFRMYRQRPYSREDHWRWYLQLDAKPPADSK